jgi:hypothetical protein
MNPSIIEILGTALFAIAVLHTFCVQKFLSWSHHYPPGSIRQGLLHLLGEIEVVFGIWAAIFLVCMTAILGPDAVVDYQGSLKFTEPLFVFCIMVMAATRPVLGVARAGIYFVSRILRKIFRTPEKLTELFVILTLGPLMGSLITEPAAMTVTAMLLISMFRHPPARLAYFLMAVLFVNVSVGGALTHFAAPPILMVAKTWNWDLAFVFQHFGLKSIATVVINALLFVIYFRQDLTTACDSLGQAMEKQNSRHKMSLLVMLVQLIFLLMVVLSAHHESIFMGIFLLFLGWTAATKGHQDPLRLRESLLVGFFLAGIIVFGSFQKWWLEPLLTSMSDALLFKGAAALTAITDNAALTYLGAQVPNLSDAAKYSLVAGAIAGGGLTVIANAPNPAGYSILSPKFPGGRVSPFYLFAAALIPTAVALICLWFLPH